jgi:hypothetical protein
MAEHIAPQCAGEETLQMKSVLWLPRLAVKDEFAISADKVFMDIPLPLPENMPTRPETVSPSSDIYPKTIR